MTNTTDTSDLQLLLRETVAHLEHLLPGQGPILDFVHHNTIHGFQHQPFFAALADYEAMTGIRGFQSEAVSRNFYQQGRIDDSDLDSALEADRELQAQAPLSAGAGAGAALTRKAIYRTVLLHELPRLSPAQLQWQLNHGALERWQPGVSSAAALAVQADHEDTATALQALWQSLLARLNVPDSFPHAEDYSTALHGGISGTSADAEEHGSPSAARAAHRAKAMRAEVDAAFASVGTHATLRTLVLQLSGIDVLDTVRPQLIRFGGSLLDEGLASWHIADAEAPGLYQAWRRLWSADLQGNLLELAGADALIAALPDDVWEALEFLLRFTKLPEGRWAGYLEALALELPGWAGLINWRQHHPRYHTANPGIPRLEEFLAIRLVLDHLVLARVCGELWHCGGDLQSLWSHFRLSPAQLHVCTLLHAGELPEYLTREAGALMLQVDVKVPGHVGWDRLAERIRLWQAATADTENAAPLARGEAWRLFCLCQHLGLGAAAVAALSVAALHELLQLMEGFTPAQRGRIWLQAFERHYRDDVFTALHVNHRRGGWLQRNERPEAQIVMCMDEREESFRRNLEELNPHIETLGAAGFFGIPMQYQGIDSIHSTPLCPVVVTPAHKVDEVARAGQQQRLQRHRKGWQRLQSLISVLHQRLRIEPVLAWIVTVLLAPLIFVVLLLDSLLPDLRLRLSKGLRAIFVPDVTTELQLTADHNERDAHTGLQSGFTHKEQSERVAGLLRTLGLIRNFAPIVALAGHGSTSLNNPHEAAHDCGACGGRQGGPNARAFAAMANTPEVRKLLAAQGIDIPDDCWFLGLQHDTCSDALSWYDTDLIPAALQARYQAFRAMLARAQALSARERCRRFATARGVGSAEAAFRHVTLRSQDGSQVRPEYGHATNAAAVIGRRQMTQGVFFDRRLFLISYDPTTDESGRILENILMTAGPVGAGINLEYYFSTIDNERFGCGTKIPHNVTGLFGVMEGASSDLRTGLPLQMVEIHEAMRLQVIVEARLDVVARIYGDNPPLQELIGGGWLLVSVVDPDTGVISVFDPEQGFVTWQPQRDELPVRDQSLDCYIHRSDPVAPLLIRQPAALTEAGVAA